MKIKNYTSLDLTKNKVSNSQQSQSTTNIFRNLFNFTKYQSLGNDFIILDFYKQKKVVIEQILSNQNWKNFVITTCNKHIGIGADGILIIIPGPEVLIFNTDGSKAEICLNGLRCISDYLFQKYKFPNIFKIKMGNKNIETKINGQLITNKIAIKSKIKKITICAENNKIEGFFLEIPNPHFIIEKKVTEKYLLDYGEKIENHYKFKNKTNIEFVYKHIKNSYNLIVHERGVGPTQSCSSGAAAVLFFLFKMKKIEVNKQITIEMPGGKLICWINKDKEINLQANTYNIFSGTFSRNFLNSCFNRQF